MRGNRHPGRRGLIGLAAALALLGPAALAGPLASPIPKLRPEPPDPGMLAAEAAGPAPGQHQSGVAGWMVADLDTGEILDAANEDLPFAPASVAKLPTAFYAMDVLGPDFRFLTRVAVTGRQIGDTLEGDMVLIGGGDPELDTDDLMPLVTQCRKQGFRRVAGKFLVDDTRAPGISAIDGDQPPDAAYNPGLSGLNLNFNRVRLKWDARAGNHEMRVSAKAARLDPDVAGVQVLLADLPSTEMFSHRVDGRTEVWHMNATGFRGHGARWLPVRRPALYAGEVFQRLARENDIVLTPARIGTAPKGARVIATHQSRPLRQMLDEMLHYSTNLTAEAVGVAATAQAVPGAGAPSLETSAAAMNAWAAEQTGFAPGDAGFQMANHSGLTTASRVSPRRMVEFLTAMARREQAPGEERPRLPGGTIDLVRDYNVAAKSVKLDYGHLDVVAKTGTMDYVRGLAGWIVTPSGRRLAFAIFSNDLASRGTESRRAERRWIAQARDFERRLIRNWVLRLDS